MKKLICCLILFSTLAAEIQVSVPRDTVKLNESIQVIFKSDQRIKAQPDFTPLENEFEILSQNQSSSTRIINGKVDHDYSWTLTLMSKREGTVTIPSIRFGSYESEPVPIQVTEAKPATKGDPIFFEVEVTPQAEAYEQSQLTYTVRFFRSVNLYNGRISDITVSDPDAIIEPLGEDKEYDQMVSGTRYLVLERKYAVFPQHAGELTFSPVVFDGQIVTGGRSIFNMQTQHTQLNSDSLTVRVKPIPPPFTRQNWLAAEQVKLTDEWSGDITKVKAGEPITRTVTILAEGCLGSQIPNITIPLSEDLKQYPDKPQTLNQMTGSRYTGVKQIKVALIASEAGTITLPEVELKWWDVKADRMRRSFLPQMQLEVFNEQIAEAPKEPEFKIAPPTSSSSLPLWAWGLIGLNGLWIAGFGAMWYLKRKPRPITLNKDPSLSQVKQSLKHACETNDSKKAEQLLLLWAKKVFTKAPFNLAALTELVSGDLQEEIEDLNESLYSPHTTWIGEDLWEAFRAYKVVKQKKSQTSLGGLRDLYGSSD